MIGVRLSFSKPKTLLGCRDLEAWMRREGNFGREEGGEKAHWLVEQTVKYKWCLHEYSIRV